MIMVEALSTLLVRARELGAINWFEVTWGGKVVTHFQFVDDIILFSLFKWEEVLGLKIIVRCF